MRRPTSNLVTKVWARTAALAALGAVLAILAAACGPAATPTSTATPTAAPTPTATATPGAVATRPPAATATPTATPTRASSPTATPMKLSGTIEIDGSSTVFPVTQAVAEEFSKLYKDVRVNVGISGTGGGFKRFVVGETDISNASRPISQSEKDAATKNGVEYIELKVAIDGLSVLVNPQNNFVQCLTVSELKKVWQPGSTINNWKDIRAGFPDRPLTLYGPGTDSGTFDYFTEEIMGKAKASRSDYTASEDDNVLVQGIYGDRNALGYFGYAYYVENKDKLKVVAVDAEKGAGCITPSDETIEKGTYTPLSRPLFIYVSKKSMGRPEVKEFVRFYLQNAPTLVKEVGYIALPAAEYQAGLDKIK